MRASAVVWKGTLAEQQELLAAVERNCRCQFDTLGLRTASCPPHEMLVRDQRALDGLLWTRRLLDTLMAEEGIIAEAGIIAEEGIDAAT